MEHDVKVACLVLIIIAFPPILFMFFRTTTPQEETPTIASHMSMTNTLREDVDIMRQDVNNMSDAMATIELLIVNMANKYNANLDLKLHKLEKEFSAKLEANLTHIMLNFEKKFAIIDKYVQDTRLNMSTYQTMQSKTISAFQQEVKEEIINVNKSLLKTISFVTKLQKSNVSDFEIFANKTLKQINMSTAALEDRLETVNKSMKLMESTETEINEAIKAHKEIVDIVINDTYNKYPKVLTGTLIAFLVIILGMYMYLQSKMTSVLEDAVRVQVNVKMKEYIQRTANYESVNEPINGSDTA